MDNNTQLEEDNTIRVVTGNRPTIVNWSDNGILPADWMVDNNDGWSDNGIVPSNWNLNNSNMEYPGEGWREDGTLPDGWKSTRNNITVKRDNRCILASKLPTMFVTNHRSFFPKYRNFVDVMHTLDLTLGLHSEIWEDKEKKDHRDKIEEALEIEGIQYISNTRPDRRGGGAAISLMCDNFSLTKLDVLVPKNLEVVWGLVRPKKPTTDFKGIIVCSFYSVPHSKRKRQLVEHIAINHGELKTVYKGFFFVTGGDKNDLEIKNILDISQPPHA